MSKFEPSCLEMMQTPFPPLKVKAGWGASPHVASSGARSEESNGPSRCVQLRGAHSRRNLEEHTHRQRRKTKIGSC